MPEAFLAIASASLVCALAALAMLPAASVCRLARLRRPYRALVTAATRTSQASAVLAGAVLVLALTARWWG